ncbi:MAG: alpha/beta fold hydrolase [Cyclobacteriaceae bacterium]
MKHLLLLSLIVCELQAVAQTSSLEQFLSHPIANNLAVSQDKKQYAWVLNDHGKRNIYHRNAQGQIKKITSYDSDDGQVLSGLTFTNDGSQLIYVRGSDPNRKGEIANPASLPDRAERIIWCVGLNQSQMPYKLAEGANPKLSSSTNRIVYSKSGQIFTIDVKENAQPQQLFHARGSNGNYSFSTDGREIVFESDRGDHGFIGIYNLESQTVRWIAPEVSHDAFPVWSPNGKQIAYIRTPGTKAGEFSNLTGGTKFSIWVAEAASGKAKRIWQSPGDDGGFSQYYPSTPLAWTKSDKILFYSEHEGWNHLYAINPDGVGIKDLTPGDGIVESYCLNADETQIYFDGNREDTDRRHIWKSSLSTGKPTQVTSGAGIEMYPTLGDKLLFFQSTYNTSMSLVSYDEENKSYETISPKESPSFSPKGFVIPQQVIMKAADGTTIHGQLFINENIRGQRPGVVFMHGGPIRQMLLGFHYSDYYINTYAFNQFLASQGYAVISVNYRDGIGYGRDFRRAENQGPRGASEYQDVVAAAKYLQGLKEVDPQKIGLWGGSYGGYLTAMGLARNPEIFKAGVDLHGVHDWAFRAREFSPGGGWGIGEKDMDLAYQSSPISDLSKWFAPVLLVHGDDDRNVLFQQTTDLAEKLRDKGLEPEILALPDEVHGFLRYESWLRVFEAAAIFFDQNLK